MLAVIEIWYQLDDKPWRVLTKMAVTSLDDDDPPIYYGGWEDLALAIGRRLPPSDTGDKADRRERRAAQEAVREHVRALIDAGAVWVFKKAAPGRNTTYGLKLGNRTVQAQPASLPTTKVDGTMQAQPGNDAGSVTSTMQAQPAPKEKKEDLGGGGGARAVDTAPPERPAEPPARCPEHLDDPDPPKCGPCGDARRDHKRWQGAVAEWELAKAEWERTAPRCQRHPHERAYNCRLCRAEQLGGTE
ncbi:MAG TPA: hypothetical protein VF484_04605 [Candidatus Limnocylindrales bacterium]